MRPPNPNTIAFLQEPDLTLITLIVTATTAGIALFYCGKTAHFVNDLWRNLSIALYAQEDIEDKMKQMFDDLLEVVNLLGEEIVGLKCKLYLDVMLIMNGFV